MKTTRKTVILLTLVALSALLLGGAAGVHMGLFTDVVTDLVVRNVEGHPKIDRIVHKIPDDCLKCHQQRNDVDVISERE